MKTTARITIIGGVAAAGALLFAGPAAAAPVHQPAHKPVQPATHRPTPQPAGAVFVQTDNLAGNTVVAYDQAADGTLTQVGAPENPLQVAAFSLIFKRRNFAGSLIGGLPETQEMLDFCAEKGITADIEMIRMDQIEQAYARMLKSDVKYRFVIDMASLKAA